MVVFVAMMEVIIVLPGLEWGEKGRDSEVVLTEQGTRRDGVKMYSSIAVSYSSRAS